MLPKKDESSADRQTGHNNLTREAYQDVRRMIFMDELHPGQKVNYRAMAERLGMSLTPVVQALKQMDLMELVQHVPNRGFFIKHISPEEIDEAFRLRELLEVSLIPHIIAHLDDDGEQRIRTALDGYLKASQNNFLKLRLAKDMNFHMTLATISCQTISIWILRYLLDFLYLRFGQELIFARPLETAAIGHQKISDYVIAREIQPASEAMRDHVRNIRNNAMEGLQSRLKDSEGIDI